MSEHTPGPWAVRRTAVHGTEVEASSEPTVTVAWCGENASYSREGKSVIDADAALANAQLIAAAPDLLEASDPDTLDAIADEIDCFEHSARAASLRGIAKRQRAAISKAEGRS